MSRRRYISTDASVDRRLNQLASCSDFAALIYVFMIPHADDQGQLHGDADEIFAVVMPMRRDKTVDDFADALREIGGAGLVEWDEDAETVSFPAEAFYRYQSYVKPENRRKTPQNAEECRETPKPDFESNSGERRKTPQNAASSSSSFPSSFSISSSVSDPISSSSPPPARDAPPPPAVRDLSETILAAIPEKFRWEGELRDEVDLFAADFAGRFEDTANAIAACRRASPRELPFPGNLRKYMPGNDRPVADERWGRFDPKKVYAD